jgi:hypothetical protein
MPHLPPAHHETSKRDSSNETKIKEKQNKTIPDSNSNLAKLITHHNQTTWFLRSPFALFPVPSIPIRACVIRSLFFVILLKGMKKVGEEADS